MRLTGLWRSLVFVAALVIIAPGVAAAQGTDTDGDGILDSVDNCFWIPNPDQSDMFIPGGQGDACSDLDGDGILDAFDPFPFPDFPDPDDADGDGVSDSFDNCPFIPNPDQADTWGLPGIGDACDAPWDSDGDGRPDIDDPFPFDPTNDGDGDGISGYFDNCPDFHNPDQSDKDSNGVGDACEPAVDNDLDGIFDDLDNCVSAPNPDQDDLDRDGAGDACDADDDGDLVPDVDDNCAILLNADQQDDDNDGLGNVCDATFDAASVVDAVERDSSKAIDILKAVNPPGVNGLIAKLSGPGGIPKKVADAVTAYLRGVIDGTTFLARLDATLGELGAVDGQLSAKTGNGQIPAEQGGELQALSAAIRQWIETLKAGA